jgi:hypothetical protein
MHRQVAADRMRLDCSKFYWLAALRTGVIHKNVNRHDESRYLNSSRLLQHFRNAGRHQLGKKGTDGRDAFHQYPRLRPKYPPPPPNKSTSTTTIKINSMASLL